jgi:hypothetical protein
VIYASLILCLAMNFYSLVDTGNPLYILGVVMPVAAISAYYKESQ